MPISSPAAGYPTPMVLSSMTDDQLQASGATGNPGSSSTWPAAAAGYLVPVYIDAPRTYVRAWWLNGATVAGNIDVGLYTVSGTTATRVGSSGAIAQAGASVLQTATVSISVTAAGLYYLAMSCSSVTSTVWGPVTAGPVLRSTGWLQITSANPLPASGTVVTTAGTKIPVYGLSELATI